MSFNKFLKKTAVFCLLTIVAVCTLCVFAYADEGACTHENYTWVHDPDALPTCTAGGYRYKVCQDCGEHFDREAVDKLGHSLPAEYTVVDPTCNEKGEKYKECTHCHEKVESIELPVVEHERSNWLKSSTKPVTCTSDGEEYIECIHCHEVLETKTVKALGHKMLTIKHIDSTCTKDGHTEGSVCANCGLVEKQSEKISAEHKGEPVVIPAVPATKDAEGLTEGKMCPTCGAILEAQQVVPKLSYTWLYILIGCAAVIVLAVVVLLIIMAAKKSKAKKAAKLAKALEDTVSESENTENTENTEAAEETEEAEAVEENNNTEE